MKYDYCLLCNEYVHDGQQLINGNLYHYYCYDNVLKKIERIDQNISNHERKVVGLRNEIEYASSFLHKIKQYFRSSDEINIEELNKNIADLKSEIDELKNERNSQKYKLTLLYDFWPNYPPDWEERKGEVFKQSSGCHICNSNYALHLHHIIPISRGGNHKLGNLILLCEDCHRRKHGGREFTYTDRVDGTSGKFIDTVSLLKSAISLNKFVSFNYTRFDGGKSVRSIKPYDIKEIQHSLCIVGYCYLRKEERAFAIRRMKNIQIIEAPGRSHRL